MRAEFWKSRDGEKLVLTLSVAGMFLLFVLVNLSLSRLHGRLAMIPTYDDINYMADALVRLSFSPGSGIRSVIASFIADPPHAPASTLTAMAGFWLLGPEPLAAYIANSWVALLFLWYLARLSRPLARSTDRALFIATFLFIPAVQALVMEFRPDLPAGLVLGIALSALCGADILRSGWKEKLGLAALGVAATIVKPSAFILVLPVLAGTMLLVLLRAFVLERAAVRETVVGLAQILAAYLVMMAPLVWIWGPSTYAYVFGVLSTYADVWRFAGGWDAHLLYNSYGVGGLVALGKFFRNGGLLIIIDLVILALRPDRRQRGVVEYYLVVAMVYAGLSVSSEKTVYQGSFFYFPYIIAFAGASIRVLTFIRDVVGFGWLVRLSLGVIVAIYVYKMPIASFYYGAEHNAFRLRPVVDRITTYIGDIALANIGNPACSGRPLEMVFTDSLPIPTELVRFEAAKIGVPVTATTTFMARDFSEMTRNADEGDVVLIADPAHRSPSRWLPGVDSNPRLLAYLDATATRPHHDVVGEDGKPLWMIVNPRCIAPAVPTPAVPEL